MAEIIAGDLEVQNHGKWTIETGVFSRTNADAFIKGRCGTLLFASVTSLGSVESAEAVLLRLNMEDTGVAQDHSAVPGSFAFDGTTLAAGLYRYMMIGTGR